MALYCACIVLKYRNIKQEAALADAGNTSPPEGYNNAELGHIGHMGGVISYPQIMASLFISLAMKGFLKITMQEKPGKKKNEEYPFTITKIRNPGTGLDESETAFLDGVFENKDKLNQDDYWETFSQTTILIREQLKSKFPEEKIFVKQINRIKNFLLGAIVLWIVGIIFAIVFSSWVNWILSWALLTGIAIWFRKAAPKYSIDGAEIIGKIVRYRNALKTTGKTELEELSAKDPKLFYQLLSGVFALGIFDEWSGHLEGSNIKAPEWFNTNSAGNEAFFVYLESFSSSFFISYTPPPELSADAP